MSKTRIRTLVAAAAASAVLLLAGCSGSGGTPSSSAPASSADALSGSLTVYAAASLKAAFDESIAEFVKEHPGVTANAATYDGSSTLATQLIGGAKADVFASADEANMKKVTDEGLASDPTDFATNTLVIAVPKDNPAKITSLADLSKSSVKVVLCAPEVPCGAAAKTLLANEGVTVKPVSLEQNVTAVLTKVQNGEADAGLVYVTDAKGNDQVDSIVPDGADKVVNTYPIVALKDAPDPDVAAAFVEFVTGSQGQDILASFGFGAP
jgi:molybdate transport system substrate-binding protein